jgi:hypothetical protein
MFEGMEPEILRRGKEFHQLVQAAWAGEIEGAHVHPEHRIHIHSASNQAAHDCRGRIDIFVDKLDDFVTVIEIKSTDWDQIPEKNRRKLLSAHSRQVLRCVEKFLDHDHVSVCASIIYPKAPAEVGRRSRVEDYLNAQGIQVGWYR